MQEERIKYLTGKFFRGEGSEAEMQELAIWIKQNPDDEKLGEVLANAWQNYEEEVEMPDSISSRILSGIFPNEPSSKIDVEYPAAKISWLWAKIAVAAVLILSVGLYWFSDVWNQAKIAQKTDRALQIADVLPGGNRAVLTLSDGSAIVLDSAKNGSLGSQGNSNITKSKAGELIYDDAPGQASNAVVFNTITTPKGGQYHIVLPDGSGVWLNAASSLKFPTSFSGNERRVEITGEVYFEVAHNAQMPFVVKAAETEVRVLGTHFNIMAYPDEKMMKTTLLEGAVKVSRSGKSALLSPGQQAGILGKTDNIRVLNDVDTDKEMAWKNGYFQFEDEDLESIMRQVSRWYDVEITYEGNVNSEHFTGRLPRNAKVSKVLKILSLSGVEFRIEDKSIIVTP